MTKKYGPTIWNAYRMRNFWQSGDPPVVYSECGIDRCRDAPNGQYEPSDDGPYGWVYQYDGNLEQATTDITRYAYGLDRDWEWGATLFTTSPNNEWREKGFDCDPMVPRFVGEYAPWTPNPIPPEVPVVPDIVLSVPMRTSIASPDNYRVGPRAKTIGVVIHTTRGGASSVEREYTATINWFQNPDAQVSAHLVVGAGTFSEVCRSVHDDDVAWHARSANATHLGIEIAQPNLNSPISEFQYQAAAEACRLWAIKYNFPLVRVMNIAIPGLIGHEDTAEGKLDRKSDPGPVFDWDKFIRLCRREIVVPAPPTDAVALQEAVWALGDQLMKLGDQYTAANSPHRGEYCRSTGNAIKEWVNTASKGQQ
jgi:N-acetyl-anhydromuramyl-L-alanine amidase AmpD